MKEEITQYRVTTIVDWPNRQDKFSVIYIDYFAACQEYESLEEVPVPKGGKTTITIAEETWTVEYDEKGEDYIFEFVRFNGIIAKKTIKR